MTNHEKLTIRISLVAVIISAFALFYTIFWDIKSTTEQLSLDIEKMHDDYETNINTKSHVTISRDIRAGIATSWVVTLSNNGQITSSITDYYILGESNKDDISIYYPSELTQLTKLDGTPLSAPFTIEPGYSKRFLVTFDYPIKDRLYEIIDKDYPVDQNLNMSEFRYQLNTVEGVDIWGNEVSPFFVADSLLLVVNPQSKYNSDNELYSFTLLLKTSKGYISEWFEPNIGQPIIHYK